MNIRFKEVKEIENKEEKLVNKGTNYKYTSAEELTNTAKKKLERPNFTYTPKEEIRIIANQDNEKRKLR